MFTPSTVAAPDLIAEHGRLLWRFPDGKTLPVVRGGDDPDTDDKKFTQADLDRIVQDRVARAKAEPPADYEDLKRKLADLEAKDRSDLENAQARITALETDVATAKAETDTAKAETATVRGENNETKRRMAVVAAAANHKAVNPDQVFALLPQDAVTIGDDGQVTGADDAVKAFIEANPHFVGSVRTTPASRHQGGDGTVNGFGDAGRAEAAKRFGTPAAGAGAQQQQQ